MGSKWSGGFSRTVPFPTEMKSSSVMYFRPLISTSSFDPQFIRYPA